MINKKKLINKAGATVFSGALIASSLLAGTGIVNADVILDKSPTVGIVSNAVPHSNSKNDSKIVKISAEVSKGISKIIFKSSALFFSKESTSATTSLSYTSDSELDFTIETEDGYTAGGIKANGVDCVKRGLNQYTLPKEVVSASSNINLTVGAKRITLPNSSDEKKDEEVLTWKDNSKIDYNILEGAGKPLEIDYNCTKEDGPGIGDTPDGKEGNISKQTITIKRSMKVESQSGYYIKEIKVNSKTIEVPKSINKASTIYLKDLGTLTTDEGEATSIAEFKDIKIDVKFGKLGDNESVTSGGNIIEIDVNDVHGDFDTPVAPDPVDPEPDESKMQKDAETQTDLTGKDIDDMQNKIKELEGKVTELNSKITTIEKNNKSLLDKNTSLSSDIEKLKKEKMNLEAKITELNKEISKSTGNIADQKVEITDLNKQVKELNDKIIVLEGKIKTLNTENQSLTNKISELEKKVKDLEAKSNQCSADDATKAAELEKVKKDLASTKASLEKAKNDIESGKLSEAEKNKTITSLNDKITQLENKVNALTIENTSLKSKITELEKQLAASEKKASDFKTSDKAKLVEIEALKKELVSVKSELNKTKQDLNNEKISSSEKTKKIEELNKKISSLSKKINEVTNENSELKSKISNLEAKAAELTKKLESTKTLDTNKTKELERIKKELADAKAKLEQVNKNLSNKEISEIDKNKNADEIDNKLNSIDKRLNSINSNNNSNTNANANGNKSTSGEDLAPAASKMSRSPKTGDSNRFIGFIGLIGASVLGLLVIKRRKSN